MSRYRLLIAFAALSAAPCLAHAAAGPTFGGPIGATDLGNAYLPPKSGFYLGAVTGDGWGSRLYNNDYKPSVPAHVNNEVTALYLMYKYPFKVLGGDLASGIEEGYQNEAHIRISAGPYQSINGWTDTYVDFLNWARYIGPLFGESHYARTPSDLPYGLTVKAEYSMIFPTGHYSPGAIVSPSAGTFFYIPNAAITYLTPPDILGEGVELNLHAFLDVQSNNQATEYQSGNVVDLDYAIGQKIRNWTVGVAGAYAFQTNDDQSGPRGHRITVSPDGDRLESLTLGPIASVYIPSWRMFLKVKAPLHIADKNTLGVNSFFFTVVFKL